MTVDRSQKELQGDLQLLLHKENRPGVGAPERPALRRVPKILHESSTWYHLRSADTNVSAIFVPIFQEVNMKTVAIYCRVIILIDSVRDS